MKKLTDIVWKEIGNRINAQLQECQNSQVPVVVIEAAVLIEAK